MTRRTLPIDYFRSSLLNSQPDKGTGRSPCLHHRQETTVRHYTGSYPSKNPESYEEANANDKIYTTVLFFTVKKINYFFVIALTADEKEM